MFLYVLVEDIKNRIKLFNNTHIFDPYFLVIPITVLSRLEAELRLTDPLLKPDIGDVLDLGVSRRES